jgi:phytoene/squalene synthetase
MGVDSTYCLEQLARLDRDRYLTVLTAPAGQRDALAVLAAFNLELARVAGTVSEQMLGLIRLQWWREALAEIAAGGPVRRHEVATALAAVVQRYQLPVEILQQMVDARERDIADGAALQGIGQDLAAVEAYLDATSGNLIRLGLLVAGHRRADALVGEGARLAGIAYGLTGLIRACLFHAREKRLMLPRDILQQHDIDIDQLFELRRQDKMPAAIGALAAQAEARLRDLRRLRPGRRATAALLPARLAALQLERLRRHDYDLFDYRSIDGRPIDIWRLLLARLAGRI